MSARGLTPMNQASECAGWRHDHESAAGPNSPPTAITRKAANQPDGFLSEVSSAETQEEALGILAGARDLLRSLPRQRRADVLRHVNEMIDEKPVV